MLTFLVMTTLSFTPAGAPIRAVTVTPMPSVVQCEAAAPAIKASAARQLTIHSSPYEAAYRVTSECIGPRG